VYRRLFTSADDAQDDDVRMACSPASASTPATDDAGVEAAGVQSINTLTPVAPKTKTVAWKLRTCTSAPSPISRFVP
jgi:hypothetical protein